MIHKGIAIWTATLMLLTTGALLLKSGRLIGLPIYVIGMYVLAEIAMSYELCECRDKDKEKEAKEKEKEIKDCEHDWTKNNRNDVIYCTKCLKKIEIKIGE